MKKTSTFLTICGATLLLLSGCKDKSLMDNPFLSERNTPYNIPEFEKIKPEHYLPAFEEGIRRHDAEIEAIVNNSEAPNFENTIEALEYSGELLSEVSSVFFNMNECESNDEMDQISEVVTPMISTHGDNIYLNEKLFERIKSVYNQRESLNLEPEQARLLQVTYDKFVHSGANVPKEQQARFRELNEQIASLTLRFAQNTLKASNDYQLVLSEEEVSNIGLSADQIATAKEAGDASENTKGKYVFTLSLPSWEPFMQNCTNRDLRKQMWDAYSSRCNGGKYNNNDIIDTLVNLRLERANILGFPTHADYVLSQNLAKTPQAVYNCLMQIWTPALNVAKSECAEYQKMLSSDEAGAKLEPWDWRYYSEKLRKEKYDLQDDVVRPYFALENVLAGAFNTATKLYGITFRENDTLPNYDKEAHCYEVIDGDNVIGILYMDFFPRPSKRSGAWMTEFRGQKIDRNGKNIIPIIQVVCNFTKPTGDKPSLLNFDESETLFHEFGHALHGLLSKCHYGSIAGTNVPRDFVELPSQVMENWCRNSQVMKTYAKHYLTGEVIPDELIKKIAAAQTYGQGFVNTELLAASLLDMDYHSITQKQHIDPNQFEKEHMDKIGLIHEIISRYKSSYFQHVFTTGYDAGYYSYTWTAILDHDAFAAFVESGDLFNPELAKKFRHILESGYTVEPMDLYREFRGKEPSVEPLLKDRGLI